MSQTHPFRALPLSVLAISLASLAHAADLPVRPSVADLVKQSKPSDWRPLDPNNTLYMELPTGRVVIELAPEFAPQNIANIKTMVKEQYFDGLAMLRSQDNYVAQWGDPNAETTPKSLGSAKAKVVGEFTVPMANDKHFVRQPDLDGYAPQIGHSNGFPVGRDPKAKTTWLAHCYATVGVGRDNDTDSGNGAELYAITGHAPRHLDRNITAVGRVVSGMPLLAGLPRGGENMGFYGAKDTRLPIKSVRLEADVPEAERSHLEVMRSEAPIYKDVVDAARNRGGPWNKFTPHYVELCNAPMPVREHPKE
ncbi:peptidylprolyl isomerase [Duganella sp. BJB488]|uniref:peptidylprolyl isomerase n=1 Tax=unclassified Duganella TaxID=2636909 RepID=UPI000E34C57C|nr:MULTISPECIES: peptidylprolyl isomerase [unclassified Duganella]RFP26247.1 peptidylprolyl isomerase [Duganella sp. BJB489]RFP28012.1 peptidylprolyl isomerase [Duganella sp. BJB488]RFP37179.1 peptidylprolyl isomerase [Duganella sp. BJB480]